jgi:glutathione S-transferase
VKARTRPWRSIITVLLAIAAVVRYWLLLIGGLATLLFTLQLLNVQVGQLVLGGAITGILIGIAAQQTMAHLSAGLAQLAAALEAGQDVTGDAPAIADLDSAALGPGADLGAALAVSGRPAPAPGSLDRRLARVLGELSYHLAKPLAVPRA